MFEAKYKITKADMLAVNKKAAMFYVVLYLAVSAVGIAIGVAALFSSQKFIYVLGAILVALGGLLLLCAILLAVAPRTLLKSVVQPSDAELSVVIDKTGIAVDGNNICALVDITKIKNEKTYLLVCVGKDGAFIIKNVLVAGDFAELYEYIKERRGRVLITPIDEDSRQSEQPEHDCADIAPQTPENNSDTEN